MSIIKLWLGASPMNMGIQSKVGGRKLTLTEAKDYIISAIGNRGMSLRQQTKSSFLLFSQIESKPVLAEEQQALRVLRDARQFKYLEMLVTISKKQDKDRYTEDKE